MFKKLGKENILKFEVRVHATDWCGFDSHYTIEAESEEEAEREAEQEFISEWDLILYEDGMYGEHDDFDEDGEPLEELSSISTSIEETI